MLSYIEYLNLPTKITLILVISFLIFQIIGEILELKGKVVPEFMKIRKYFSRRKKEKQALKQVPETLEDVRTLINEVSEHYSLDNIDARNRWIDFVNKKLDENDKWIKELDKKIDKNNEDTLSLLIDSKRNTIINFASHVIDENSPVTREQFNRIFKIYQEYEDIIEKNNLTNGEVNIAFRIITEAYENHMRNHTFVENVRGYDDI
jgi:hypothetical protein